MAKSVPEQIADDVFALLPVGTATAVGRRALEAHRAPPSVVAVMLGAPQITLPQRPGDQRFTDAGRSLLERRFVIEWHCHAASPDPRVSDFGAAETLYLKTLKAVRKISHNDVEFDDERWIDQEEGADGFVQHGHVISFRSTIVLPVRADRSVITTLTATPPIDTTFSLEETEI